ncbi:MAG: hypothetical protein KGR26_14805, partial [Cyanobacteria bacterium REEB65]|nr:hypothetical protein [Cyanobacteria bacterium REEB65]
EAKVKELTATMAKVQEALNSLEAVRARFGNLDPDKEVLYQRLTATLAAQKDESVEVAGKVMQARGKLESLPRPKVMVRNRVHPGVHIRLNDSFLHNEEGLRVTEVYEAEGKVKYS